MEAHLEILEYLQELKFEGLIRSIALEEWPIKWQEDARRHLGILAVQKYGNWLVESGDQSLEHRDDGVQIWWNGSLIASNFFQYFEGKHDKQNLLPPKHLIKEWELLRQWQSLRAKETNDLTDLDLWRTFRRDVLHPVDYLKRKYEVSERSILMRWMLQRSKRNGSDRHLSSLVVPFVLSDSDHSDKEGNTQKQLRELRDVFRFHLDTEDERYFRSFVVRQSPPKTTQLIDDEEVPLEEIPPDLLEAIQAFEEEQVEDESTMNDDYPEIDFNNPDLWL